MTKMNRKNGNEIKSRFFMGHIQLKSTAQLVFFLWLVKSLKNLG